MRPKNFNKKLVLNKKTIANLSRREMEEVEGGERLTLTTWCVGSCLIIIGGGSGCLTVYPEYCMCPYPK